MDRRSKCLTPQLRSKPVHTKTTHQSLVFIQYSTLLTPFVLNATNYIFMKKLTPKMPPGRQRRRSLPSCTNHQFRYRSEKKRFRFDFLFLFMACLLIRSVAVGGNKVVRGKIEGEGKEVLFNQLLHEVQYSLGVGSRRLSFFALTLPASSSVHSLGIHRPSFQAPVPKIWKRSALSCSSRVSPARI